jgi:hypothetical protein
VARSRPPRHHTAIAVHYPESVQVAATMRRAAFFRGRLWRVRDDSSGVISEGVAAMGRRFLMASCRSRTYAMHAADNRRFFRAFCGNARCLRAQRASSLMPRYFESRRYLPHDDMPMLCVFFSSQRAAACPPDCPAAKKAPQCRAIVSCQPAVFRI